MNKDRSTENQRNAVRGLNRVFKEYIDVLESVNADLEEFVERNPVFASEFEMFTRSGGVEAPGLQCPAERVHDSGIHSEWDFAVAYGYREGVEDVVSALDGETDVPFDLE